MKLTRRGALAVESRTINCVGSSVRCSTGRPATRSPPSPASAPSPATATATAAARVGSAPSACLSRRSFGRPIGVGLAAADSATGDRAKGE